MLPPNSMEKEYEQIARTPFAFLGQVKACFMEAAPYGDFLLFFVL